jgi:hypothetical protein
VAEQDLLRGRYDAAIGTAGELAAYMRLQDAGDRVAASEAWVHWVDDRGYRGLNAGPFELRAEVAPRTAGRVWLNGREIGGEDRRYAHLDDAHD